LHVLKRWAAWPQGTRWLAGGIAAVVVALAIAWVLFVPGADWLARHDVGPATGSLYETALDNARGRLLTLGAGLFAAGALVFTARNFTLSRRTFELTEQGQVTDRYTKAIEQLGSDKLDVRLGGIYALERVARDSARDHPAVIEVLAAFVREYSHEWHPLPGDPAGTQTQRPRRADVQAALTVIGRRDAKLDTRPIILGSADLTLADLGGADLGGADFTNANLTRVNLGAANLGGAFLNGAILVGADLGGADLGGAELGAADLTGATLTRANLHDATLRDANLTGANLYGANLGGAFVNSAILVGAILVGADFGRANLGRADFRRANLGHANLHNANLIGANLTGATLRDANLTNATLDATTLARADLARADLTGATLTRATLTRATLTDARWPADAPVPEGWKLDAGSGRLATAGTDSGPAEAN
jgi:uncharacterized protein YjbI with pentapeptide repeats